MHLRLHNFPVPKYQWEFNIYILDAIKSTSCFSLIDLLHINKYRVYLQVYILYDLVIADSNLLHPSFITGERNLCSKSKFQWPKQIPTSNQKRLWKQIISLFANPIHRLFHNLRKPTNISHITSLIFSNTEKSYLTFHSNNYTLSASSRTGSLFKKIPTILNSDCNIPIDYQFTQNQNLLLFSHTNSIWHAPISPPTDVRTSKLIQWIQKHVRFQVSLNTFTSVLFSGQFTIVSDGSFFPNKTSLILATLVVLHNDKVLCIGKFIATVRHNLRNAYTAELAGILSALLVTDLHTKQSSSSIQLKVTLDFLAAMDLINDPHEFATFDKPTYDLTYEIWKIVFSSKLQLETIKIKAYLDDLVGWNELSILEKFNVFCNHHAKQLIIHNWCSTLTFPFILHAPTLLHQTSSNTISSSNELYNITSIYRCTPYLNNKLRLPYSLQMVDWWNLQTAFTSLSKKMKF